MRRSTICSNAMWMSVLLLSAVMGGCRDTDGSSLAGVYCQGPYRGVLGYAYDGEVDFVFVQGKDGTILCAVIVEGCMWSGDMKHVHSVGINGRVHDFRPLVKKGGVYALRQGGSSPKPVEIRLKDVILLLEKKG